MSGHPTTDPQGSPPIPTNPGPARLKVADLYDLDRALADRLFGGAPEDDPFVGEAVIRGLFRIANVFDVTPRTVKRWIATGRLRVHRVGRHAGSKPTLYLTVSEAIEVLRDMAATVQP